MTEAWKGALRRQPPSVKSTKLLTKTSILMVSVLFAANLIMAKGISYTNSASVPAVAPTSFAIQDAPTQAPTSHSSKTGKRHKKHKSRSSSNDNTSPAFGLEASGRRRKAHKSRTIRPHPETAPTKQTAFVRESPTLRRKGHKGRKHHSNRVSNNIDSVPADLPKKTKSPKRKSPKTRRTLNAKPSVVNTSKPEEPIERTMPGDAKNKKSHKTGKHRSKKSVTESEASKQVEEAVPTPEIVHSSSPKKGTKRKRRKAKIAVDEKITVSKTVVIEEDKVVASETVVVEEVVASVGSAEDSAENVKAESSPPITESKPTRKKKRRKKTKHVTTEPATSDVPDVDVEADPTEDVAEDVEDSATTELKASESTEAAKETEITPDNGEAEVEEGVVEEGHLVETPEEEEDVDEATLEVDAEISEEKTLNTADKEEVTEIAEDKSSRIGEEEVVTEAVAEYVENVDQATQTEGETETIAEEASQADVSVDVNAEGINVAEEINEVVEQAEEKLEVVEEESIQEDADVVGEIEAEIVEEKTVQIEADVVLDEPEDDDDEGGIVVNEVVSEEVLNEAKNVDVDEPIAEENIDEAEVEEVCESENDKENEISEEIQTKETEALREASEKDHVDEDVSSSESSGIDPNQDVVSFIEEVLHEDVRSWIEGSDSHAESVVNKTRGGHIDIPSAEFDEKPEAASEIPETLEIVEEECEATNAEDPKEESQEKPKILDRESLEKSNDKDSDAVVSVVTWNLAEDSPMEEDAAFIRKFRKNGVLPDEGSDLVLISGQECENIKPRRSEGRRSREYRRLMIKMLGRGYVPLALHLLGGIQFGLFAKRSFLKEIEDVSIADVTCGIGNVFHNKGAIAAFLKIKARNQDCDDDKKRAKTLRMVFVTAHLNAHVKNADARDSDFWRISSELEAQAPEGFLPRKPTELPSGSSFLFDSCDRVFFCGDLNYRLDLPRELTEHAILHEDAPSVENLMQHDQLIHSMAEGRAFPKFGEGKITFMPTFKYDKESDSYDTSHKQRIPAWTDRILFQPSDGIRVLDYKSVPEAQSSDHRPVWGSYRIGMEGKVLPPAPKKKKRRKRVVEYDDDDYF